jgi:hypothetical protein
MKNKKPILILGIILFLCLICTISIIGGSYAYYSSINEQDLVNEAYTSSSNPYDIENVSYYKSTTTLLQDQSFGFEDQQLNDKASTEQILEQTTITTFDRDADEVIEEITTSDDTQSETTTNTVEEYLNEMEDNETSFGDDIEGILQDATQNYNFNEIEIEGNTYWEFTYDFSNNDEVIDRFLQVFEESLNEDADTSFSAENLQLEKQDNFLFEVKLFINPSTYDTYRRDFIINGWRFNFEIGGSTGESFSAQGISNKAYLEIDESIQTEIYEEIRYIEEPPRDKLGLLEFSLTQ